MTTNDYDARLARLNAATRGDTVTIPDGWEKPSDALARRLAVRRADLRPGDVFTHDGEDELQWELEKGARARIGNRVWYESEHLAQFGLDVDATDAADEPADEPTAGTVYTVPAGTELPTDGTLPDGAVPLGRIDADGLVGDHGQDDDEDGPTPIGSVTVRVIPDTDGFVEAVAKAAGEAADAVDAAGFHLDEYQRERVAALEQALRILESRRAPDTSGTKTFGDFFARSGVPMVGVRDVVYVAAFIAEAETGAVGEVKA